MKFRFRIMNKEVNFEFNVERNTEEKDKNERKKTRYQIRQEEKRKMKQLQHEQDMQSFLIDLVALGAIIGICMFMYILSSVLGLK